MLYIMMLLGFIQDMDFTIYVQLLPIILAPFHYTFCKGTALDKYLTNENVSSMFTDIAVENETNPLHLCRDIIFHSRKAKFEYAEIIEITRGLIWSKS